MCRRHNIAEKCQWLIWLIICNFHVIEPVDEPAVVIGMQFKTMLKMLNLFIESHAGDQVVYDLLYAVTVMMRLGMLKSYRGEHLQTVIEEIPKLKDFRNFREVIRSSWLSSITAKKTNP